MNFINHPEREQIASWLGSERLSVLAESSGISYTSLKRLHRNLAGQGEPYDFGRCISTRIIESARQFGKGNGAESDCAGHEAEAVCECGETPTDFGEAWQSHVGCCGERTKHTGDCDAKLNLLRELVKEEIDSLGLDSLRRVYAGIVWEQEHSRN